KIIMKKREFPDDIQIVSQLGLSVDRSDNSCHSLWSRSSTNQMTVYLQTSSNRSGHTSTLSVSSIHMWTTAIMLNHVE
ncbi:hypothetical protein STEG23_006142, partial [Scotinomys teguina]